jgi:thiamine biosynthesis protein ThiI
VKNVFLVKYGEIAIKGKNRYLFENRLVDTIRKSLNDLGMFSVKKEQGRIMVEPLAEELIDEQPIIDKLSKIFGIVGIAYGLKHEELSMEAVKELVYAHMQKECLDKTFTFKVETRRADKRFPLNSMEINAQIGEYVLEAFPGKLTVDVHRPDRILMVELRNSTYVYSITHKGAGGMPYGTNGKATLLLSGGIDSPVAGWMTAKRGVEIDAVYFHSPPYTSERAREKVIDLGKKIAQYTGGIKVHVVPFTAIQMAIYEKCPHGQLTLIMRRMMMRIAEKIAVMNGSMALITGESIGQVASQTMQSLVVTDSVVEMPVFRPLIGFDKEEIVQISKKIDTYETSILPYEDCCTVFVPKNPEIKPRLDIIKRSEEILSDEIEEMIATAIGEMEIVQMI